MSLQKRFGPKEALSHLVLLALAFATLFPFYWMLVTSMRPPSEVFDGTFTWLPETFTGLEHYRTAFSRAPLLQFMFNGVVVCLGVLAVQLLTAIPCAYALAKFEFRGSGLLFGTMILVLTVPIQVPALPLFLGLAEFDLLDTYFAMMLPFFLSAFAIYLFRQVFRSFPDEIIQAARIDGISEWEILWRIVVPAAKPAIAAFAVFSITAHWNDLYWPLIVVTSTDLAPPPLGMMYFADNESGANFGALMASATILTAPLIVLYLFAQRHFVTGITMTGVK
ncbi:carbohydrate ABC transporter permease [Pseudogemmobacter faecipullorum]|uniref:sn-glycerol-3-phosphate transport system permease protein UgpE n=1 Tax=Pseudogemmobacter faecipullorum TaxID=2755041 RepID=A0ABS8CS98_9RHOB|nr:carbohydrate ABC transporter permease [Pseudogemmobacter faecipullorum]MCB5412229.1 carbohydrate ABC transporter permease [Pseudogemmobacter faecipullorum]